VLNEAERVRLTTSCHDADAIPKVEGAGAVMATPHGSVQVMHNGVLVVEGCYYGEWTTDIIRNLRGHHEPQEEIVFHEIVERLAADTPRPTMFELGAFWAYYSLWMLHRIPETRAILVEPDPNNLEVGRVNLALNGQRAEMLQAAVGGAFEPPRPFVCESDGQTRLVPTENLPSLLTRFSVPFLDLLLIDVQGAELALLEGARGVLTERVRFLIVSTHHEMISGDPVMHERCLQLLTDLGAHIVAEHTVAESFSGDGLIAASFDPRDRELRVPISYARAGESLFGDPVIQLAHTDTDRNVLRARLTTALTELAVATETVGRQDVELNEIKATATWRLHQRLLRSRGGRTVLGTASRAARALHGAIRPRPS
jgi:FkbM family methyltransferase